jgi:hypothetical protein
MPLPLRSITKRFSSKIFVFQILSALILLYIWKKATALFLSFPKNAEISFSVNEENYVYFGTIKNIFPLCISLSIIPLSISLILSFREKIISRMIKKYSEKIGQEYKEKSEEILKRSEKIVKRIFVLIAITNLLISLYMLVVAEGIFFAIKEGFLSTWFIPFFILTPILIAVFFIIKSLLIIFKGSNGS